MCRLSIMLLRRDSWSVKLAGVECVCPIVTLKELSVCEINGTWCMTVSVMRSRIRNPYFITTPLGSRGGSQLSHTDTAVWLNIVRLSGGDVGPETQNKTDFRQTAMIYEDIFYFIFFSWQRNWPPSSVWSCTSRPGPAPLRVAAVTVRL